MGKTAYEFDSPVEFVLIFTVGRSRAVVAKSKGAKMDLAAYAQRSSSNEIEPRPLIFAKLLFPKLQNLRALSVDSMPFKNLESSDFDTRQSRSTLVWRGVPDKNLHAAVEERLSVLNPEIVNALEKDSSTELEWLLSPLIDLCNIKNNSAKESQLQVAGIAFFGTLLTAVYALVALAYFFTRWGK